MFLLPQPEKIDLKEGFLPKNTFCIKNTCEDPRIATALQKLPQGSTGIVLEISCKEGTSEGYTLEVTSDMVTILGDSAAGAFYGIQTLRQLLENGQIPCLTITDKPGFSDRGFYHDVTRGKIPTVQTMKEMIDQMAYFKMNSLQIYVEHTFPFAEFGSAIEKNGYLTADEIRELDDYCYENFIEFIPSIATFGHLYELLELDEYRDLQELENFTEDQLRWHQRMAHHTIDPTKERSIEVVKSMIDQYMPLFRSNRFNICCDETFDLTNGKHKGQDTGRLYIEFVKKIIEHVQSRGKQVMMWADILLQHPETVNELPKDVEFLNWYYDDRPKERNFAFFENINCTQIVCPGTTTWSRLVEGIEMGTTNILKMCDLGYKYHAKGMLNTNWGDYGNPCSIELAMHGFVLGAAKSWNEATDKDAYFDNAINYLVYKNNKTVDYLTVLDQVQNKLNWNKLAYYYSNCIYEKKFNVPFPSLEDIQFAFDNCKDIIAVLENETWEMDEYRQELLIAAEGLMVMAQMYAKFAGYEVAAYADVNQWLKKYRTKWLEKNKESELFRIEEMFTVLNQA